MPNDLQKTIDAAYQRGVEAGRLAVRRELNDAIDVFNNDDSKGMGDIIAVLDPFFLTKTEERAYDAEKSKAAHV